MGDEGATLTEPSVTPEDVALPKIVPDSLADPAAKKKITDIKAAIAEVEQMKEKLQKKMCSKATCNFDNVDVTDKDCSYYEKIAKDCKKKGDGCKHKCEKHVKCCEGGCGETDSKEGGAKERHSKEKGHKEWFSK